jgi:hypothetical protein
MTFYRDHVYPQLVKALGDPKPIREVRERIVPLAEGRVLEIGVGPRSLTFPGSRFPWRMDRLIRC